MTALNDKVAVEREGEVLVILINNPPINAGSLAVRRGLLDAVALLEGDPQLRAAVIIGRGTTFIAGSDLREFGQPLEEPQLPAVIHAIEQCTKPVVAALHGAALGGGFELALGCDARVAAPGAVVGLPEVTLGMIPGAGGTQRLPRLVGVARAITVVCSGERLKADAALRLGIVDAVAENELRAAAVHHAAGLVGKRRLRDVAVPADAPGIVAAAAQAALAAGRHRPNVRAAIERVQAAAIEPVAAALVRERELFQQFRMSDEAAALRHLFFAERDAARLPDGVTGEARPLRRVGVVGSGPAAEGLAAAVAGAGIAVSRGDDAGALPDCELVIAAADAQGVQPLHLHAGLLEIVAAPHSDGPALATALALAKRLRLQAVIARHAGGIGERVAEAGRRARQRLVAGGALAQDVEAALAAYGFEPASSAAAKNGSADSTIVRAVVGAMAAEGARLLAEGVALRAGDIDVAAVHGHGFPRWEGGPMRWAERQATKPA